MVVGALDLVELDEIGSSLEQTLEKPVDVTLFTAKELRDRIKGKDTFVLRALKEPKIALTGGDFLANPRLIPYNV